MKPEEEKEIRYLQIENAYLKELRRLRLEERRNSKNHPQPPKIIQAKRDSCCIIVSKGYLHVLAKEIR